MSKSTIHTYVQLLLKEHLSSQAKLARTLGCSRNTICQVLLEHRDSPIYRQAICNELGFHGWDELRRVSSRFYEKYKDMVIDSRAVLDPELDDGGFNETR